MRFAGSTPAPRSNYTPRSGRAEGKFEFDGLQSAGVRSNAAGAADAVSTSSIYGSLREAAPKYDEIATTAAANRASERISAAQAEGSMAIAGIQAKSQVAQAEAAAEAARAQGEAAKKGGMMSAVGGIASAAIGLLSDETTKHTIEEIEDALSILRQLRPVTFYYKDEFAIEPGRRHNGFIAQELNEVMPHATHIHDDSGLMCIDINQLIAVQARAIQQLEERVIELEAKLVK